MKVVLKLEGLHPPIEELVELELELELTMELELELELKLMMELELDFLTMHYKLQ